MGKQRTTLPNDNLTISRIHVILRPFETKLNVLAKTLERKIAEDKYAPRARQPGVTYAKRHRIRAMTGMNSRQAGRAYALEKSKGLSTLYSFHEPLIGVEDAFRNLIKGIPLPRKVDERVPSLQALVCQMVGRQVAEETLRDKEELEAEGVEDCIGLWYGGLSVNSRKHALIAHAVQLVELKIPFFILELWTGLLTITMQAGLLEESYILLEYILLYYFTPDTLGTDCPAANMTGRDLTDLYNSLTGIHSLPPAEYFTALLPIIEASPNAPAIWSFRCIQHLIRNLDGDVVLLARVADSMARTLGIHSQITEPIGSIAGGNAAEKKRLSTLVESKVYDVLALLANPTPDFTSNHSAEIMREVGHLAWTTHHVSRLHGDSRLMGLSLALDVTLLVLIRREIGSNRCDVSDAVERLESEVEFEEDVYITLVKALYTARPTPLNCQQPSTSSQAFAEPESFLASCLDTLRAYKIGKLTNRIEHFHNEMVSQGADLCLRLAPLPSGLLKRSRPAQYPSSKKRRKLSAGWKGEDSDECTEDDSESEVATERSASVDGDDSAGEKEDDEVSVDDDEDLDGRTLESRTEEEEELEDDSDTNTVSMPRQLQPSNRVSQANSRATLSASIGTHIPPPLLRTVVSTKAASALMERLAHRTREQKKERVKMLNASSEDDLDLLGSERRKTVPVKSTSRGVRRVTGDRWSTP